MGNGVSIVGNIIWLVFGGLLSCILYFIGGAIFCITIIGIPFGLQAFNMGKAVLAPFGKQVVDASDAGVLKTIFDVIWILLFGWETALTHLISGVILGITIVGIPFALQHFKLIPVALLPFSKRLA
jgi:uncharacterized membrane protein YccF (DUF307 family)